MFKSNLQPQLDLDLLCDGISCLDLIVTVICLKSNLWQPLDLELLLKLPTTFNQNLFSSTIISELALNSNLRKHKLSKNNELTDYI